MNRYNHFNRWSTKHRIIHFKIRFSTTIQKLISLTIKNKSILKTIKTEAVRMHVFEKKKIRNNYKRNLN